MSRFCFLLNLFSLMVRFQLCSLFDRVKLKLICNNFKQSFRFNDEKKSFLIFQLENTISVPISALKRTEET